MDLCGLLTQFANGKTTYFHSILDDHSNYSSTALLLKKNQAFRHFRDFQAWLELKSNNKVLPVCYDDAKEFVKGKLKDHLNERGISLESMAAYVHQQNRKAEQYIQTLENTAQILMAKADLPISFLGDAVLTAQYLRNCIPTFTLPDLDMPYKVIEGHKPDLSHLRVWDCQCFVLFPKKTWSEKSYQTF